MIIHDITVFNKENMYSSVFSISFSIYTYAHFSLYQKVTCINL